MPSENRRSFLKKSSAAALTAGSFVNWNSRALGANERINLALIGGHNQGKHDVREAIKQGAFVKTFCDIDDAVLNETGALIEKAQGTAPAKCKDFNEVLGDKDIDAVMIVTPDHWHAIMTILACQAGKDVYCEKPLSQTIHEGLLMRNAARKFNRIVQTGTQRRSMNHYKSAVEFAASGKLGDICLLKAWMNQVRESIGNPEDSPVPEGVDYDRWLGPAPQRPFNKNRFHYTWRFFWDYGNTEEGNQGVHMLDICLWYLQKTKGLKKSMPRRVSGQGGIYWLNDAKEVPDTQVLTYDFEDVMLVWELHSFQQQTPMEGIAAGVGFYGTEATLFIDSDNWRAIGKDGKEIASDKDSGGSHVKNFFDCIKSRDIPNADVEIGRQSALVCHLGNISHRLGRDLIFDGETSTFKNDKEANAMLTKEYREPYVLPNI